MNRYLLISLGGLWCTGALCQRFSHWVRPDTAGMHRREMMCVPDTSPQAYCRIFKGPPVEGVEITWYPDGMMETMRCGREHFAELVELEWYPDGRKRSEHVTHVSNEPGYWNYWYPDGTLQFSIILRQNKAHGRIREWDKNGVLIHDEVMKRGRSKRVRIPAPRAVYRDTD
jgi:hypothetical protein